MDSETKRNYIILTVVVLVLATAVYFVLGHAGPSAPTPAPGQTLQNPFGTNGPPTGNGGARGHTANRMEMGGPPMSGRNRRH